MRRIHLPHAGLLLLLGCAPAINLSSPDHPRFEGHYAPLAGAIAASGGPIRVVTFNIKFGRAIDSAIRVLEQPPLREADVLALEEMDPAGVERIAQALRLNYVYFPAIVHPTPRQFFGPALLSRWPIEQSWKLVLPHEGSARHQRRTATAAILRIRGTPVRVYAVHLETQTQVSREEHRDQAAAIVADAAGSPDPVVIAGDFNSYEIGWYLTRQGYRWPTARVGRTTSVFSWDHVFARGLLPVQPAGAGVIRNNLGSSDHHPVWADLQLEGAPGPRRAY